MTMIKNRALYWQFVTLNQPRGKKIAKKIRNKATQSRAWQSVVSASGEVRFGRCCMEAICLHSPEFSHGGKNILYEVIVIISLVYEHEDVSLWKVHSCGNKIFINWLPCISFILEGWTVLLTDTLKIKLMVEHISGWLITCLSKLGTLCRDYVVLEEASNF